MRASTWFLVATIAGCRPSATVQQTMPVANLQAYQTVALRVQATAFASQGQAMFLEQAVVQKLQRQCGFLQVARATGAPTDLVLDLNITGAGRGSSNWGGSSQTIDTLLVVTDGVNGDLLGTARIQGKSSGMMGNNAQNEAIDVVAKTVADVLAKSGCSGPRIARAAEPPPPPPPGDKKPDTGTGTPPDGRGSGGPPDDKRREEAEALNEAGKLKLRSADVPGALASFQQATALVPDARYQFNVCLAFEAAEQWDNAVGACRQAASMNPDSRMQTKIDKRLELLQKRK